MDDTTKSWHARVRADLACFSDPGTTLESDGDHRHLLAEWTMNGRSRDANFTFSLDDGGLRVGKGPNPQAYRAFLSELADLRQLAQVITRSPAPTLYVDVNASLDAEVQEPAITLLGRLANEDNLDRTRVMVLKGDAGAGKTQVLTQLAKQQATNFLQGQSKKLFLYVNAQGRALARLDEALAIALQDLRSSITYHAIPSLTRSDLLVPIIDGFDELLGVAGYEDAFSSLGEFLEKLGGEGQILASARSIYYEEEFLKRADRLSRTHEQAWSHTSIEVAPWSDENREQYLQLRSESERLSETTAQALTARIDKAVMESPHFFRKPLFFTKAVDLLLHNVNFQFGDDLLTALVDGFLDREQQEKLLDGRGTPILSRTQLKRLLAEIAQEMWTVQTRELDPETIREVAQLVFESQEVNSEARQVVIERAPTLAFLTQSDAQTGISFEHESFFFDFLAQSIMSDYLESGANLKFMLGTSALAEDVAERVGMHLRAANMLQSHDTLTSLLGRLCDAAASKWFRSEQVRENAGRLVMEILRTFATETGEKISNETIHSLTFPGGRLRGITFCDCAFRNVSLLRTDLVETRFENCRADAVWLIEPLIARESTRLELEGMEPVRHVTGVRLPEDRDAVVYSPDEVFELLAACGMRVPTLTMNAPKRISDDTSRVMDKLMRAYRRANPICESDDNLKTLFQDSAWPAVRESLLRHRIVTKETRAAGGGKKIFLRRQFLPEQVMAGIGGRKDVDNHVFDFWNELAASE